MSPSLTVHPGDLEGTVPAPPSKSLTHRGLFAALVAGGGTVANPLWSKDTHASLDAVTALGGDAVATKREVILRANAITAGTVDAANSGTTLRFATAIAALAEGTSTVTGDASLRGRPIGPLVEALQQLGAEATCEEGTPPVEVTGPLDGGKARIPGDVSSQFVSALLLAAPRMPDGLTLDVTTPMASRPYVDLTVDTLERFGVPVEVDDRTFRVHPGDPTPARLPVPGDYSGAAFGLVAGAIAHGPVTVTGLAPDTPQGDAAIVELLERFGARVTRQADRVTVEGGDLEAAQVEISDTPDLFPPLCALAACAEGTTVLEGAPHLRDKESDRVAAMVDGLAALGVDASPREDGAEITGTAVQGGSVDAREDHRVQMAFAVLGLAAEGPIQIEGPIDAHAVSYPGFLDALTQLGARFETEEGDP